MGGRDHPRMNVGVGSGPLRPSGINLTAPRRILRLAFLAPELQAAILEGRQPPGLTMRTILAAAPALLWSEQITAFEG